MKLLKLPTLTQQSVVPDNAEAGFKIRLIRTQSKVSLRELARRMKISAMFLCDLEYGRRNWTEELFSRAQKEIKNHE